jgi:hypothetical protein
VVIDLPLGTLILFTSRFCVGGYQLGFCDFPHLGVNRKALDRRQEGYIMVQEGYRKAYEVIVNYSWGERACSESSLSVPQHH